MVRLSDETASSLISSSVVFRTKESKAGDLCRAQLVLYSNAMEGSTPITPSSLRIEFEGSLKPIVIDHASSGENTTTGKHGSISELIIKEEFSDESSNDLPTELSGTHDLTLHPGQRRVFEMAIPLRESGEAEVSSVLATFRHKTFDLEYKMTFKDTDAVTGWYVEGSDKPRQLRADTRVVHIEPLPPKLQITLLDPQPQHYTNEVIELRAELRNEEEETATVKLDIQLFGQSAPSFKVNIGELQRDGQAGEEQSHVTAMAVGAIASGSAIEVRLTIDPTAMPTTYDLHLRATYHLESDTATPIIQVLPLPVSIVGPFEANYDLVPRPHPDPWPSLFDYDGLDDSTLGEAAAVPAKGLAQQWCLVCHYASFASEDLVVTGTEMQIVSCVGAARCNVVRQSKETAGDSVVSPKTIYEAQFDLVAQKLSLDDRDPVTLDLAFVVRWKRRSASAGSPANITTLPVGQYLVLGTEPRVLATAYHSKLAATATGLLHLEVTIENPSNHFLTFGLGMEPSDAFGFSGPKQTTIHLLPMSRRTTTFRLLPFVRGDYIRPGLVVRDKYFQKVLRIIPTEGMKIDKDGLLVWVPEHEGSGTNSA